MAMVVSGSHHPIRDRVNQFWKNRREQQTVHELEKTRVAERHAGLRDGLLKIIQDEQDSHERYISDCIKNGTDVPQAVYDARLFNESARISAREYFASN